MLALLILAISTGCATTKVVSPSYAGNELGRVPAADVNQPGSPTNSACFQAFLKSRNWPTLQEKQKECFENDSRLKRGLQILCTEDQSALSQKYLTYIGYESKDAQLRGSLKSSTDPNEKEGLRRQIIDNEQDWRTDGFRALIDSVLVDEKGIKYSCAPDAPSGCLKAIGQAENWDIFASAQWSCIDSDNAKDDLAYLCNTDRSDISVPYSKYLQFAAASAKAYDKLKNAKDAATRNAAITEIQQNDRDWSLFGFKQDVMTHLNSLDPIEYRCTH